MKSLDEHRFLYSVNVLELEIWAGHVKWLVLLL